MKKFISSVLIGIFCSTAIYAEEPSVGSAAEASKEQASSDWGCYMIPVVFSTAIVVAMILMGYHHHHHHHHHSQGASHTHQPA
ncbi:MAG: hypothetical protein WCP39_00570 [Chlamydiota bacterium]